MASHKNKIVWSEGLFLRPQHFQQHDRYLEHLVNSRCGSLGCYDWGFSTLNIDRNLLKLGKLAVTECQGILPDGTPFSVPDECDMPPPLTIPEDVHDETVFLALPLLRHDGAENDNTDGANALTRYLPSEATITDNNLDHRTSAALQVGRLKLRLLRESEDRSHFACLGVARVTEVRPEQGIIIDAHYLPPCLDCTASSRLSGLIKELHGLLRHRSEALATRVMDTSRGAVADVADFLLLQAVNRYEPLVSHLANIPRAHPELLFRTLVQIAGELATFSRSEKRPPEFAVYRHDDLQSSFDHVMKELRYALTRVLEQKAIAIALEERKYGVRVAPIADRALLSDAQFILAVAADLAPEVLQTRFPAQVKIGSAEYIRQLVNSGLPGIGIRVLPVAPRQIPYHAGFTYFELDRSSRYWQGLEETGTFAIHVGGDFPGLKLEFWAIKE